MEAWEHSSSTTSGIPIGLKLILYEIFSHTLQIISITLNGAILCTLWKKYLFHSPSNKFVFSLCFSQFILSGISLMISLILSLSKTPKNTLVTINQLTEGTSSSIQLESRKIHTFLIYSNLYALLFLSTCATITIALISIDRYITIGRPMNYKSIVTPARCNVMIGLTWLFSAVFIFVPIGILGNSVLIDGAVAVPKNGLGLYYACLFSFLSILLLSIMTICYNKIFKIAKEKCQKVTIGSFTAPISSISSDWPSSHVYSSQHGALTQINNNNTSPHSNKTPLLTYVLLSNLHSKNEPTSSQSILKSRIRNWSALLHQKHNSRRKTVGTILLLIGSVILTHLPLSFALFSSNSYWIFLSSRILAGVGSNASPLLYGFLNRSIRQSLWKFLGVGRRRVEKIGKVANKLNAQKSLVEVNLRVCNNSPILMVDLKNKSDLEFENEKEGRDDEGIEVGEKEKEEFKKEDEEEEVKADPGVLSSSFPRKPSQDSGADVSFSEDEGDEVNFTRPFPLLLNSSSPQHDYEKIEPNNETHFKRFNTTSKNQNESCSESNIRPNYEKHNSETYDDEFSRDNDEDNFEIFGFDERDEIELRRFDKIMRKKFSLTEEDAKDLKKFQLLDGITELEV